MWRFPKIGVEFRVQGLGLRVYTGVSEPSLLMIFTIFMSGPYSL